jgi:PAS domain S-box-containing protein
MQNHDNYQWLFRNAPVMATLIGADGRYLDVNDALLTRLGYSLSDMLNESPASFVTADSAERIENELLPTLRRTGRLENKRIEFVTASGEVVPCITSSMLESDPGGTSVRTLAMYTEMAESANADWKYRQLYRSTPAMLHIVDANGCLVTATDHWLQKMGYSREEMVGRSIADFFSDADRERISSGRLKEIISGGSFQNEERQMVTRDGELIDLVQSAISERDASGRVNRMLVASKDVTERNSAERALRKSLAENAKLREELERERDYLREEVDIRMNYGRIVGRSAALRHMLAQVEAVAGTPVNVLVLGESGVGKELVARASHARSSRAAAPLVKVNCASIPRDLFESEFFGHVRGAFTGAHKDRVGRFQLADGGTIFLDEVGEIPAELQGKLLRVLQESEYERVGDDLTRKVDVRVIAATNKDLKKLVDAGEFREDLFYRLSVFPIEVPPLRKRREDLVQLAVHFLKRTCEDFAREPYQLTRAQVQKIEAYDWPGNVRELKNVIERAVILSNGGTLRLDLSLPESVAMAGDTAAEESAADSGPYMTEAELKAQQKKNLLAVLGHSGWRVSGKGGAAELLGIRPTTLTDRIKSSGIKKPSG